MNIRLSEYARQPLFIFMLVWASTARSNYHPTLVEDAGRGYARAVLTRIDKQAMHCGRLPSEVPGLCQSAYVKIYTTANQSERFDDAAQRGPVFYVWTSDGHEINSACTTKVCQCVRDALRTVLRELNRPAIVIAERPGVTGSIAGGVVDSVRCPRTDVDGGVL
jgi:hypothetical protein